MYKILVIIFLWVCIPRASIDSIFVNKIHYLSLDDICSQKGLNYKLSLFAESFTLYSRDTIYLFRDETFFRIDDSTIVIRTPPIIYKGKFFVSREVLRKIFPLKRPYVPK